MRVAPLTATALVCACASSLPAVPPSLAGLERQVRDDVGGALAYRRADDIGRHLDDSLANVRRWAAAPEGPRVRQIDVAVVPLAVAGDGLVARVVLFRSGATGVGGDSKATVAQAFLEPDTALGWRMQRFVPDGLQPGPVRDERRRERWIADIETLRHRLPRSHMAPFHDLPEASFHAGLDQILADLDRLTAVLVGQTTSNRLNSYGEVGSFLLPGHGLVVTFSSKYHRLVDTGSDILSPDVRVGESFRDLQSGADAALQAALRI
jgi:hypothetical protein